MEHLSKDVIKRIEKLGFTKPFIADLDEFGHEAGNHLKDFVNKGHHASMAWMAETLERRSHPQNLWPEAKAAIVLGMNYGPNSDPLLTLDEADRATISVYARGLDYHDVMKGRLKEIAGLIARDTNADVKVFVDTAPLMEKPIAHAAGLGWQGKHTNLVSRDYGSWLFIGTILSAAILSPTLPETDHCVIGREAKLAARDDLNAPELEKLATLGEERFRRHFSKSPIKRIGWLRFLRNVLYAMGNSRLRTYLPVIEIHLGHNDPVIKEAAQWAKASLTND